MTASLDLFCTSGADFSPCRRWRYRLLRIWDHTAGLLAVMGLNPSTADEVDNDPTVRRWIGFARAWGYGGIIVVNMFAWRSTNPSALLTVDDPVGQDNDEAILGAAAEAREVLVCWGAWGDRFRARVERVGRLLSDLDLVCLGTTKSGQPLHPLYMPRATARRPFIARLV